MADKDTAAAETKDTAAAAPTPEPANGAPAEAAAPAKKGGANAWFSRALGKKKDSATAPAGAAPPPPGMAKSKAPTPPPPGMKASSGAAPTPATAASTSTAAHAALLRDRFLSVLTAGLLGHPVTVRQTDGTTFEAVFHTFTPFASKSSSSKDKAKGERNNVYVFKAARIIDGDATKFENGSTVVVPASKVAYVLAKSVPNAATGAPTDSEHGGSNAEGGFRTDTDISRTGAGKDRDLVAAGGDWTSPPPGGRGGGLEDAPSGGRGYSGPGPVAAAARQGAAQSTSSRADAMMGKGGPGGSSRAASAPTSGNAPNVNTAGLSEKDTIGKWDQFAANEQLFNVRATYDENLYTTALDKSSVGAHKQREAARLAREIEGQTTSNIHLAEERGQKVEGDYGELDEEDKYSGVLTSGGKVRAALAKGGGGDKKGEKKDARKDAKDKAAATAPKAKMSWAAMAGAGKAAAPAPPQAAAPATKKEEGGAKKEKDAAAPAAAKPVEEAKKEETKGEAAAEKKAEEKKEPAKKAPTKLSASAKAFTFNPGATTFTPGGGGGMGAGGVPGAGGMGGGPPMPMPGQPMYMQHPQGELGLVMVLICSV